MITFAIGTGRCGTKFLSKLFELESGISSSHERDPLNDTFHRYCKWNNLSVDSSSFIENKRREIDKDLQVHKLSFEASAYLSFSIHELFSAFNCKFILLVRHPISVINSYIRKGWYDQFYTYDDTSLAIGYQREEKFHHFLGRTIPKGDEYQPWSNYSRVGKLAWYWKTLNYAVLEQLKSLPSEKYRIQQLETLDYSAYLKLCKFVGLNTSSVSKYQFEELAARRPNNLPQLPKIERKWTSQELEEYKMNLHEAVMTFGYPL